MEILIRKASVKDADKISSIWSIICSERKYSAISKPFTPEQEKEYIYNLSDREGIFVAEVNDQIIGFQSLDKWINYSDSFDHVGTIGTFIHPLWRKKQIGKKLAAFVFNFARKKGYEKLVIYVRARNTIARDFYKGLGFVEKGVLTRQVKIDNIYEDEIFMEKFL
ncbi:MAG: GNAT family N-acetyltransferase [Promethearchaeota archaeon]